MKFKQKHPWVLASGSPRRKDYLNRYGFTFRVQKASIEESMKPDENPLDFALRMAVEKGEVVQEHCSDGELIISADTIVTFDGKVLGKPEDVDDAYQMLQGLNNRSHKVISAYRFALTGSELVKTAYSITEVYFKNLSESLLKAYAESDDPHDKAGAYSIQGEGTFLVESIKGSYNNVVGFPIEQFLEDLINLQLISINAGS